MDVVRHCLSPSFARIALPTDMNSTALSQAFNVTAIDDGYAKVTEVAHALNRHERTIRSYINLLREDPYPRYV
jgi:hypothetical protein